MHLLSRPFLLYAIGIIQIVILLVSIIFLNENSNFVYKSSFDNFYNLLKFEHTGLFNTDIYTKTLNEKILFERCDVNGTNIIFAVLSHPKNQPLRESIRQTWGKQKNILFFVTNTTLVEKESALHRDIVLLDMIDTYKNLTLKTYLTVRWLYTYCLENTTNEPRDPSKLIVKLDDNVFFNYQLFIEKIVPFLRVDFVRIYGKIFYNAVVKRSESPYGVSIKQYSKNNYPPFLAGSCYFFWLKPYSGFVLKQAARIENPLPLEDVFFTGIAAKQFDYPLQDLPFIYSHYKILMENVNLKHNVLAVHGIDAMEMKRLYNLLLVN